MKNINSTNKKESIDNFDQIDIRSNIVINEDFS